MFFILRIKLSKEDFRTLLQAAYDEDKFQIMKLLLDTMFIKLNTINYEEKELIVNDLLERALVDDKLVFVEIILDVGINLKKFLTNDILKKLYMSHHVSANNFHSFKFTNSFIRILF